MLVKDIYGSRDNEYTSLGLSSTLIASSFGKAIHLDCTGADGKEVSQKFALSHEHGCPNTLFSITAQPINKADMARSLLYLVSNDIGQIATLYAMLHKVKNIYFGGFFLRHHPVSLF